MLVITVRDGYRKQNLPRWKSYSIPEELEERIKKAVKAKPDRYTSVADFIRDACSDKLKEVEEEIRSSAKQND